MYATSVFNGCTDLSFVQNLKNPELLLAFGKNLRKLRKKKNLSMKHLADLTNVEYSQIARIERGVINTTITSAHAISKALEISLNKLFEFEIPEKKKKGK
jgi:transcriptional regulator with XRE-family HTH domain